MINLFRYIGLRHIRLKPMRSFLTLLGVAFGISLYVGIAMINQSTLNSMKESIEAVAGKAKLTISAGPTGFEEAKLEVVKKTVGVKSAVAMIESRAFFEGARASADGLYILGVDLLQEQSVRTYKTTEQEIIDDPFVFLNQPDSIILTKKLAEQRGLKINSELHLATTNGIKKFTVRGLLEPEGAARAYGGSLAIMDIDGARVSFGKENKIDRIDVVPTENFDIAQLRENLIHALGPAYKIETPEVQSAQTEAMLKSYQMIITFFSTIALLVGLFLIINSISVSVAERKREIGTLRALGATRFSMVFLFVTEVIGIGLFGSALGCILGKFLANALVNQISASISGQFQAQVSVTHLNFAPNQIIFSIALGTFSSIFAALLPSLKAAKIHPLESMKTHRENQSAQEERQSKNLVVTGFIFLFYFTIASLWDWQKYWFGWDLISKAASVIGTALFGPFIVLFCLKKLKPALRYASPILKLSQENLIRSPRRTSSNVMALLVGLYLVMLIATVRESFHGTLTNWLDQAFVSDLIVTSSGRLITADVQPIREEIQNEILKMPGIRSIHETRGTAYRLIRTEYQGKRVTIKALDRLADWYEAKNFIVVDGDRIETAKKIYESKAPSILASHNFMQRHHKKVGDWINLDTPSGSVSFQILGIVVDYASSEGVFYLNRAVYKKYWKDSLVTAFVFNLAPGYSLETVRSNLDRTIGRKYNLIVISNAEFKVQMQEAVETSFAYTRAVELVALLVGLLGLLNTLLISVMERTREIGMLRAVGATRSQISKMIFNEAILQGLFGAMVAVILGGYVGYIFVKYNLASNLGWMIDFHFAYEAIFTTILTGVMVAIIAGIVPARRASSLTITDALDYE